MKVVHEAIGPPPPPGAVPAKAYRPYELTISLSTAERKQLLRAAGCTESEKCRRFASAYGNQAGGVLYDVLAGIYYALRGAGETTDG